jgi:hypothetical protein
MAISSTQLGTTNTTIYTSSGETAVTALFLCNTHSADVTVSIHVIESGGTAADNRLILKDYNIPAGDTLTFEWEKLILANGDFINGTASSATKITVTTSYVQV